jgi:hypothetical protein
MSQTNRVDFTPDETRRLRSSILPVFGRHGCLQTHGSFGYIFEQSGS